jgi:NADPH-dependent curcumin reductase CurA
LGALGVSGSHAYFGYIQPLHPKTGETLVVSSAAGNIGVVGKKNEKRKKEKSHSIFF